MSSRVPGSRFLWSDLREVWTAVCIHWSVSCIRWKPTDSNECLSQPLEGWPAPGGAGGGLWPHKHFLASNLILCDVSSCPQGTVNGRWFVWSSKTHRQRWMLTKNTMSCPASSASWFIGIGLDEPLFGPWNTNYVSTICIECQVTQSNQ